MGYGDSRKSYKKNLFNKAESKARAKEGNKSAKNAFAKWKNNRDAEKGYGKLGKGSDGIKRKMRRVLRKKG